MVNLQILKVEDAVVIGAYFILVFAIGIWSSLRSKRDSPTGYFLAGREMHWILVGASLFVSCIGSVHFVGMAGAGATSGIGVANFDLNSVYVLLLLGWVFVPVYMDSGVYTMPEYLQKRFGGQRIQVYLSVLSLLLYVFTKISADLYAGALFISQSVDLDIYGSVVALLIVAAIFTIGGGLTAVIWTDFVQTILIIVGAFVLMGMSFSAAGGYKELVNKYATVQPDPEYIGWKNGRSCSTPPDNYMHLLRTAYDPEIPWTGITFGLTVSAVWYWCADQVIVQRVLAAKDLSHAKAGCILGGYLKLLPMFLLVIPGMAARVLYPNEVACSKPEKCKEICGNEAGCSNIAYPLMVVRLMPPGARGLMLSVMLAALMSSLTSIFNSSSTIFTMDIWRRIRKQASEMELMIVGRLFVLVLVGISIIWIPIIQAFPNSQLFHYIQTVTSCLAPPVCAVFVLGVFVSRVNEQGAFWGMMFGLVLGMVRFALELSYNTPPCASLEEDLRPTILSKVHYLHFGIILFLICCIITLIVSFLTPPVDKARLHRLTFWTRHDKPLALSSEDGRQFSESQKVNEAFDTEAGDKEDKDSSKIIDNVKTGNNAQYSSNTDSQLPLWKRALFCFCGINMDLERAQQQPHQEALQEVENPLSEKKTWKNLCNANAVICLIVVSFICGFYA